VQRNDPVATKFSVTTLQDLIECPAFTGIVFKPGPSYAR